LHTIQKTVYGSNLLPSAVHFREAFPLPFKASLVLNLIGEKDIRLRPAAVQELTSLSILEREFLHSKNIAAVWNHEHCLPRTDIPVRSEITRREQKLTAGAPKNGHPCSFLGYKFAGANLLLLGTTDIPVRSATLRINLCAARSSCTLSVSLLK